MTADELAKIESIAAADARFPVAAYVLVMDGFAMARRNVAPKVDVLPGHVVIGVVSEASVQFGPMARMVVEELGLRTSISVVAAIERLVSAKLLEWGPNETLQSVVGAVFQIDFLGAVDAAAKDVFAVDPPRIR